MDQQHRNAQHGAATARRPVMEFKGSEGREFQDELVLEAYLTLVTADRTLALLACTPRYLDELAAGFAYNHGLLQGAAGPPQLRVMSKPGAPGEYVAEVTLSDHVQLAETKWAAMEWQHSPRGSGQPTADFTLSGLGPVARRPADKPMLPAIEAQALARELQGASAIFAATGAVHAAALASPGPDGWRIMVMREDVGRHNAVDKIAGWCLLNGVPTHDKVLLVTCRISADIVGKALAMEVPVLLSRSAPTFRAIETADRAGLTVLGFARGDRFVAYTHWDRLGGS